MPTFQITNQSPSEVKISQGFEIIYKKVYCSTSVDGDYLIFQSHHAERNLFRQQYRLLYSDCTNPTAASATELKEKVDAIINDYTKDTTIAGEYIAIITQSGVNAPEVLSVIKNTLNQEEISLFYNDVGVYKAEFSFTEDKTTIECIINYNEDIAPTAATVNIHYVGGEIYIYTFNGDNQAADDIFRSLTLKITKYN